MRKYFYDLLQNLDKLTGMKQYEKLMQLSDFKKEIQTLLDILCRVSDQFPYIPDDDKKRIINDAVISDQEFIGLNAKIIYKWLSMKKEFYFNETTEPVIHPEALTGEARAKRLKEFLEAINGFEAAVTVKESPYQAIREQWKPKEGTEIYKPNTDATIMYEKERHFEYIKRHYDARSGAKLPDWIPEDEFNQLYNEGLI